MIFFYYLCNVSSTKGFSAVLDDILLLQLLLAFFFFFNWSNLFRKVTGNDSHFLHSLSFLVKTPSKHFNLIILTKHLMLWVSRCSDRRDGISWAEPPSRDFLRLRGGRAKLRNVVAFRRRFSFGRWPQHWGADSHWSSGGGVEVAPLWSRHCRLQRLQTDETRWIISRILSKWKYICALHVVVKHPERHLWSQRGEEGVTWSHDLRCNKDLWLFLPLIQQSCCTIRKLVKCFHCENSTEEKNPVLRTKCHMTAAFLIHTHTCRA